MGSLLAFEIRRILRSPRFSIFTIGFPLVFFLIFANLYRGQGTDTVPYLMVSMAAFGAVSASVSTGGRTAIERQVGWNRQLRMTPLSGFSYLASKVITAMIVALPALLLVFLVGATVENVNLDTITWLRLVLACWIGILPLAAIGLLIGMIATGDSAQAISTVVMLLFSLLGGLWMPIYLLPDFLGTVAKILPSYWLAQLGHDQLDNAGISGQGVLTLLAWLVIAGALIVVRYRRDAARA